MSIQARPVCCSPYTPDEHADCCIPKPFCRHWWVIESPNGPMSIGTCKKCGVQHEFSNISPFYDTFGGPSVSDMKLASNVSLSRGASLEG